MGCTTVLLQCCLFNNNYSDLEDGGDLECENEETETVSGPGIAGIT